MTTKSETEPRGIVATILRTQVLIAVGFFAGCALSAFVRGIYMGYFGIPGC